MIEWYLEVNRVLREIRKESLDALAAYNADDEGADQSYQRILQNRLRNSTSALGTTL